MNNNNGSEISQTKTNTVHSHSLVASKKYNRLVSTTKKTHRHREQTDSQTQRTEQWLAEGSRTDRGAARGRVREMQSIARK